jgi:hypothetical protein
MCVRIICFRDESGLEIKAGDVYVLGGEYEMAWRFDRLYKHDITSVLSANGLDNTSPFSVRLEFTDANGASLTGLSLPVNILYEAKREKYICK